MDLLSEFSSVMAEVTAHQQELTAFYEKLTRPDEKKIFGEVLARIDAARQEAEKVVPETIGKLQDFAVRTREEAQQHLAMLQQRQAQTAAAKAAAAQAAAVKVPPVPEVPKEARVDPKLGPQLRDELLQRFARQEPGQRRAPTIKEAWEDWR